MATYYGKFEVNLSPGDTAEDVARKVSESADQLKESCVKFVLSDDGRAELAALHADSSPTVRP